ncbi:hypothetical protein [Lysobacter humi (ex Lee et al. 2017)]
MKQILVPALLALAIAPGCSREDASAPTERAAASPADAPSPGVSTPVPAPGAAPADAGQAPFDIGAFSGTFANGRTRLELSADGTYLLDAEGESGRGTWTHEAATGLIRLDPGTKDALDRVFRVQGNDTLAPVSDPGQAPLPVLARLATS